MISRFARLALDVFYAFALLFIGVFLVFSRGARSAKLKRGFWKKLGDVPRREGEQRALWIHAVSVGEVQTALPLIHALRSRFPDWDLSVSVSTFTGLEVASKNLADLEIFYYPFDLSWAVKKVFRARRPTAVVLVELEVWPNFLSVARDFGVPVFVANGRISARSARRYRWGGAVVRAIFRRLSGVAAQNDAYRARFLELGVAQERVRVLGNLKHDRRPTPLAEKGSEVRDRLGWDPAVCVLTAGSTHPTEEDVHLRLYEELRRDFPRLRLVIVPRHVERLADPNEKWGKAAWLEEHGVERWSTIRAGVLDGVGSVDSLGDKILLVDTVGELEMFYAMADLVFVGGSLIPHGGQNLFEPAVLGKPVVFGRHFANFQIEGDLLQEVGGGRCVKDAAELQVVFRRCLEDPAERREMAAGAEKVVAQLGGATERHVDWLEEELRLFFDQCA